MTHTPGIMEKARALSEKLTPPTDPAIEIFINLIAASLAEARAVPDGWKLVPVEATTVMINDGWSSICDGCDVTHGEIREAYKAMIASAPQSSNRRWGMKYLLIVILLSACASNGVSVLHNPKTGQDVTCQHAEGSFTFGHDRLDCIESYKKLGYQEIK